MHRGLPLLISLACGIATSSCAEPAPDSADDALFYIVGDWDTTLAVGFAVEGSGSSVRVLNCSGIGTTRIEENPDEDGPDFKLTTDLTLPNCGTAESDWFAIVSAPSAPQSELPRVFFGLTHPGTNLSILTEDFITELPLASGWVLGGQDTSIGASGMMVREGITYVAVEATLTITQLFE